MASDVVSSAIEAYLAANWSATVIHYENRNFAPPDGRNWLMIELLGTLYSQESIGAATQASNRWDEEGTLIGHIFVQKGTGAQVIRKQAKTFADLFRGTVLLDGDLEFMDADIGMGANGDDEGATYRLSVSVDWRRMES